MCDVEGGVGVGGVQWRRFVMRMRGEQEIALYKMFGTLYTFMQPSSVSGLTMPIQNIAVLTPMAQGSRFRPVFLSMDRLTNVDDGAGGKWW